MGILATQARASAVILGFLAKAGRQDTLAKSDHKVRKDHRVIQAIQETMGLKVHKDPRATPATLGILEHLVILVYPEHLVILEAVAIVVGLDTLERRGPRVHRDP